MSGDRLAQIEERVRTRAVRTGNNWAPLSNADVLALVEIAKAADYVIEADGNLDQLARAIHLLRRKRAALARLDSGAAPARALLAGEPDGEYHAEGLDERGIYGGRAYPDGGGER